MVAVIAAPSVLVIAKRVRGAVVERVPLRPCVLLRVGVLIGGEVLVGGGVIAQAGMVRERSYADISNIRINKMRIAYIFSRYFSRTTSRS